MTILAAVAVGCSASSAAYADLGGSTAAVRADRVRMDARMTSIDKGSFTRHDLTRSNGGMVREFTNPAGQVFAVSWAGPGKPDLRALLGRYFGTLQGRAGRHRMHATRRPPQVAQADLQIQTGGHMGWFYGVAYIPSLAPTGISLASLQVQP